MIFQKVFIVASSSLECWFITLFLNKVRRYLKRNIFTAFSYCKCFSFPAKMSHQKSSEWMCKIWDQNMEFFLCRHRFWYRPTTPNMKFFPTGLIPRAFISHCIIAQQQIYPAGGIGSVNHFLKRQNTLRLKAQWYE